MHAIWLDDSFITLQDNADKNNSGRGIYISTYVCLQNGTSDAREIVNTNRNVGKINRKKEDGQKKEKNIKILQVRQKRTILNFFLSQK